MANENGEVSPTGAPVIPPGPWTKWIAGVVGIAAVITQLPVGMVPPVIVSIAAAIVAIGVVFGIMSVGARKAEPAAALPGSDGDAARIVAKS